MGIVGMLLKDQSARLVAEYQEPMEASSNVIPMTPAAPIGKLYGESPLKDDFAYILKGGAAKFEQRGAKRQRYLDLHKQFTAKMYDITARKNADYTGAKGDDPFANFRVVEHNGICSIEQGFLVRMSDKMSRLATFAQGQHFQVLDESVEDTLLDLANYALLMAAYIKMKGE